MKILHYFLGFPPYRSGGLTKYAFDLMGAQVDDGNEVVALWPGKIIRYGTNPIIKKRKNFFGIVNYELINPLPISLDEGISQFEVYTSPCNQQIYTSFLLKESPDVIHLHTLMGIHKEFISAAVNLKIKTVYTSHDYFGLCPKVTLFRYDTCCDDDDGCRNCVQCNSKALSLMQIQIMQSPLYRILKDTLFIRKMRSHHRSNFIAEERIPNMSNTNVGELAEKYRSLRAYYVEMYETIDLIHFNSTLAESIFKRYINPKESVVVSITHKDIMDNRNNPHVDSTKLRILFLAPAKPYKGFEVLKNALDELWNKGMKNFELRVFSPVAAASPYMVIKKDGFSHVELSDIFANVDVLIAPSVWYETFGFTVLEALSYGVPVIVSDHVGAMDLVDNPQMIIAANDVGKLMALISEMLKSIETDRVFNIKKYQSFSGKKIKEWSSFVRDNYSLYRYEEHLE